MLRLERLLRKLRQRGEQEALIWKNRSYTFRALEEDRLRWLECLARTGVRSGQVIGVRADYSPQSISLFLALLSNRNIVALVSPYAFNKELLLSDSRAQFLFTVDQDGSYQWERRDCEGTHRLLQTLRESDSAGFVVFSSGSAGKPKAVLHDVEKFLIKFTHANKKLRTIPFLLFDHIAGIDTLFYCLWTGAVQVLPEKRDVKSICELVQRHQVEVLPTSPTFLKMLCLSGECEHHDLSSLKIITYGSEAMSGSLLAGLNAMFPKCRFVQKYGTSEFGALISKSRASDDLWINIKGSACDLKVIDGILWVRSPSAMLGYLNAPDPIDKDGWFCSGDEVLVDGDWIRILGRKAEVIIVGGEKVYPTEVENTIGEMEGVLDVVVKGEAHPLTGHIVCASVQVIDHKKNPAEISKAIRKHCRCRLEPYKVPVKIEVTDQSLTSQRHKKIRLPAANPASSST